jgi:prepilin-type N-terminal cleavage/methylation domain-containing protein
MNSKGFSLIEMIVFILIIGITATAVLRSFGSILQKSPTANRQTTAIALAQERMELILAQRQLKGFNSFIDPCTLGSPPSICTAPSGYIVSSTISTVTIGGDSNYKNITVTVSGLGDTTLQTLVGN